MNSRVKINSQSLLFRQNGELMRSVPNAASDHYYEHGYDVLTDIPSAQSAATALASMINGLDRSRLPLHDLIASRIDLAKADYIPVCDDVVATELQVLHFDMGLPVALSLDAQLLVTHVGIYLPAETSHAVLAKTRILELTGLFADAGLTASEVTERLSAYAATFGDGWAGVNTGRLACFARVLDAIHDTRDLAMDVDKTVGQWFHSDTHLSGRDALALEMAYYTRKGIDLSDKEVNISLGPGELLVIDNLRVVHGRIGPRRPQEICNLMFGLEEATATDVSAVRQHVAEHLTSAGSDHVRQFRAA